MSGFLESSWVGAAALIACIVGYAAYATRGMRKTSFRFSGLGLRVVVASEDTRAAKQLDPVFCVQQAESKEE